jgi:predicted nucleic acid-binding protein
VKFPDVNVLVAMSDPQHGLYAVASQWRQQNPQFATCAITELGLVRILMALGADETTAQDQLSTIIKKHRALFIPCDESASVIVGKITGHKQVTDAYLLELARKHKLTLATLDGGIKGAELVR